MGCLNLQELLFFVEGVVEGTVDFVKEISDEIVGSDQLRKWVLHLFFL